MRDIKSLGTQSDRRLGVKEVYDSMLTVACYCGTARLTTTGTVTRESTANKLPRPLPLKYSRALLGVFINIHLRFFIRSGNKDLGPTYIPDRNMGK
jgi:hypothetical protein